MTQNEYNHWITKMRLLGELDRDYLQNTAGEFAQLERSDVFEHLKEYLNKY